MIRLRWLQNSYTSPPDWGRGVAHPCIVACYNHTSDTHLLYIVLIVCEYRQESCPFSTRIDNWIEIIYHLWYITTKRNHKGSQREINRYTWMNHPRRLTRSKVGVEQATTSVRSSTSVHHSPDMAAGGIPCFDINTPSLPFYCQEIKSELQGREKALIHQTPLKWGVTIAKGQ